MNALPIENDPKFEPRLTVGVPCLDRASFLRKAIDSVLSQTVPTRVLVADQGGTRDVALVSRAYASHPLVRFVRSPATTLMDNWHYAAREARKDGTEFFAYLQDDDCLSRTYTAKVLYSFDRFPEATAWTARLMCSNEDGLALWNLGNGPPVAMRILDGEPISGPVDLLTPVQYLLSWALSPAVAFRQGDVFDRALSMMPANCDLFSERTILSALEFGSRIICDPCVAGYWCQHEGNENRRQHANQEAQTKIFLDFMDSRMTELGDRAFMLLADWGQMLPSTHILAYLETLKQPIYDQSRFAGKIGECLLDILKANMGISVPDQMLPPPSPNGHAAPDNTLMDIVTLVNLTREHNAMTATGKLETPEADAVLDRMDGPWARLVKKDIDANKLVQLMVAEADAMEGVSHVVA